MEGGDKLSPTECVKKYEDTGHETIVRELTQNALDAAREAGRACVLRFEIRHIPTWQLPGIAEYREHLRPEYMREWHEKRMKKYEQVIGGLRALADEEHTECLLVFDNGAGLDASRMEGLIGRGDSRKVEDDGGSGGTHGVGHETAFAAGDMNYVLYGGVSRKGKRLYEAASGHVVFPTHTNPGKARWGGHGYLSTNVQQITLSGVAIITNKDDIPCLIGEQLKRIRDTGSVVIIPAFNRFPDDGEGSAEVGALICEDIAKHFFVAVEQKRLRVEVEDYAHPEGRKDDRLGSREEVERALERVRDNRRARGNRLIAGARSHEAWLAWREGQQHRLRTNFGEVQARIRYVDAPRSRIAIVRAGMFITDNQGHMPGQLALHHFGDYKPFHAVLLFANDANDPQRSTKADNILRAAESAGHSEIHSRRGDKRMARLLRELRGALQGVLEKGAPAAREYTPEILPIVIQNLGGLVSPRNPLRRKRENTGRQGAEVEAAGGSGRARNRRGRRGQGRKRSGGRRLEVPLSLAPAGPGAVDIEILMRADSKALQNAFLQLETRTGSDATCVSPLRGEPVELDLARCQVNGHAPAGERGHEVRLGALKPGGQMRLRLQLAQADGRPLRAMVYEKGGKAGA